MDEPDHITSTRTVYDHSASLFVEAVGTEISDRTETAKDRATLEAFATEVLALGGGTTLDVGCGPGRATAFLAERGLEIRGIDLSPAMVEAARDAQPELRFDIGSLTELGVDSAGRRPPELPHEDSPQGFVTAHRRPG